MDEHEIDVLVGVSGWDFGEFGDEERVAGDVDSVMIKGFVSGWWVEMR